MVVVMRSTRLIPHDALEKISPKKFGVKTVTKNVIVVVVVAVVTVNVRQTNVEGIPCCLTILQTIWQRSCGGRRAWLRGLHTHSIMGIISLL